MSRDRDRKHSGQTQEEQKHKNTHKGGQRKTQNEERHEKHNLSTCTKITYTHWTRVRRREEDQQWKEKET